MFFRPWHICPFLFLFLRVFILNITFLPIRTSLPDGGKHSCPRDAPVWRARQFSPQQHGRACARAAVPPVVSEGDDAVDVAEPTEEELRCFSGHLFTVGIRKENGLGVLDILRAKKGDVLASFCSTHVAGTSAAPLCVPTQPRGALRLLGTTSTLTS